MTVTRLADADREVEIWRPYLRVSKDKSGYERSPKDQHKDLIKDAKRLGAKLHARPYDDVGSASEFSDKARDGFDRLLADLRADQFGAHVLPLWEGSRGSRQMHEWVELLDLLKRRGVHVWIHTHERRYDTANPRDRRTLIDEAADAEYETAKSSLRLRRDLGELADEGHPHGRVRYGYRRIYDEHTRDLVNDEEDPVEGPVILELFTRFYDDPESSIRKIELDFRARGIRRRDGGFFSQEHLRIMLMNPSYAGFRAHNPEGSKEPYLSSEDHRLRKAKWVGIVKPKIFFEIQQVLADPERKTTKPSRGTHLFSMIARCDPCGGPLAIHRKRGRESYRCRDKGCVLIGKDVLDDFLRERLLTYLERPELEGRLRRGDEAAAGAVADLERQLVDARGELTSLKAKVKSGQLSVDWVVDVAPAIEERISRLDDQLREVRTPSALRGFVGGSARARWREAPTARKRAVARAVFSPDWAGTVRLRRAPAKLAPPLERVVFALSE